MKPLLLSLIIALNVHADQEIGGVRSAALNERLISEWVFRVSAPSPGEALRWQIVKMGTTKGGEPITSGDAVQPGESYAYYWDPEKKVLWFASVRMLYRVDLTAWPEMKTSIRMTKKFESFADLPPDFRAYVRKILEPSLSGKSDG